MTENNAAQPGLNDTIRAVFLGHGFTIKEGQTDLKPYVYEAVHALLSKLRAEGVQAGDEVEWAGYRPMLRDAIAAKNAMHEAGIRYATFGVMFPEMMRRYAAALASAPVADANRWRWISAQYDDMKTSEVERFLELLGLDASEPYARLGEFVDRMTGDAGKPAASDADDIPDFGGGSGNKAKRRAAALQSQRQAIAPVAGEAQPSDVDIMALHTHVMATHADGRGFDAGVISFARALLSRYAAPQASEADGQWRDLALKFDAQRMVFRELLKAAVPLLIGPEDFKAQIEKALASSPGECLKTQPDKVIAHESGGCAPAVFTVDSAKGAGDEAEVRAGLPALDDRASYPASTVRRYMAAAVVTDRQQRAEELAISCAQCGDDHQVCGHQCAGDEPMQPLVVASDGMVRFKENRIVRKLLDVSSEHGYSLNQIACDDFTDDERMQLAQLIGYSLGGYGELSYVSDASYDRAALAAPKPEQDDARYEALEREHLGDADKGTGIYHPDNRRAAAYGSDDAVAHVQRLADDLICAALENGVVVRIDLEPRRPLAMGNYNMVADVRPERHAPSPD